MNHQFRSNPTTHHYPKIKGLWEIVSMINKYRHKRVTPLLNGGDVYGNTLLFLFQLTHLCHVLGLHG
jgi:hypothetical protein